MGSLFSDDTVVGSQDSPNFSLSPVKNEYENDPFPSGSSEDEVGYFNSCFVIFIVIIFFRISVNPWTLQAGGL